MQEWELALKSLLPASSAGKSLLNALPVAVYTCNLAGNITFFNKAAVKLWGYTPDIENQAVKYYSCFKVFVNDVLISPDQTPMAVTLQTGQSFKNVQAFVERRDGNRFHATININPIFDDKDELVGAISVFQDTSDLKEVEDKLRQSEARYKTLASGLQQKMEEKLLDLRIKSSELTEMAEMYHKMIEEVEDYAIILLDDKGFIRNWNKGAEKIKGYKEEEIIGKSFQEFYLQKDREAGLPLNLLQHAREHGKAIHEGWRKRKDGTAFWGSIVLTALHDEDGGIIGFSKVTRDLTEKKLTEDRVKNYLRQLEFQNKELEQFVYAASHDMREPLRKIHLYNSFIESNDAEKLSAQSHEFLKRSIKATLRMNNLIEDLLAYSRATSKADLQESTNLQAIIDELKNVYNEDPRNVKPMILTQSLPGIYGVPFQLKQLFGNLIDNSIKYKHPERDIVISIEGKQVKGHQLNHPLADTEKDYYRITVADNGMGFEPEYAAKIFEIFQRLIPASGIKGSGIGLAICKRIMQNHNGFIDADSIPDAGAVFNLYFPKPDQLLHSFISFSASS